MSQWEPESRRNGVKTHKFSGRISAPQRSYCTASRKATRGQSGCKDYRIVDADLWSDNKKTEEKDNYGLTPGQVETFQEVFNLFDMNRGGTINASELDAVLQTVDIHLTPAEIVDILLVIDKNSNGEIDFDEFLSLMTSTEKFSENLRGGSTKEQRKENVLFSALARVMKKSALSSLSEIEHYYSSKAGKSSHVVGHYAAGARMIGLTEKQMAKYFATLSSENEGKKNNSPYAQPLYIFQSDVPSKIQKCKENGIGKIQLRKKEATPEDTASAGHPVSATAGRPVSAAAGCPVSAAAGRPVSAAAGRPVSAAAGRPVSAAAGRPVSATAGRPVSAGPLNRQKLSQPKASMRLRSTTVPLPTLSMSNIQRRGRNRAVLTIEDLPHIRSKMANKDSQTYAFTDLSIIKSKTLQKQFKLILETYSFKPTNVPSYLTIGGSFL